MRGVRTDLSQHTPDKIAALKELGRRNLVVDFLSDITTGIPAQIIADTPTTKYQIEHLGCGCGVAALYANQTHFKQWQAAIAALAKLPNIQALQVGGTMAGFKEKSKVDPALIKPFVETVVKAFGFKRQRPLTPHPSPPPPHPTHTPHTHTSATSTTSSAFGT